MNLHKLIYRFSRVFHRISRLFLKFIWKSEGPKKAKVFLKKENKKRRLTLQITRLFLKLLELRQCGTGTADKLIDGI